MRELEQTAREMTTLLQSIHQQEGIQNSESNCCSNQIIGTVLGTDSRLVHILRVSEK